MRLSSYISRNHGLMFLVLKPEINMIMRKAAQAAFFMYIKVFYFPLIGVYFLEKLSNNWKDAGGMDIVF